MKQDETKSDKVRQVTSAKTNEEIDRAIIANIQKYAVTGKTAISLRIEQLNKEWDMEKALILNMSAVALCGIASSLFFSKYAIILPVIMLLFFIWHAFQGWCPPVPLLRYFKVRTRREIEREKYALKALRGDFDDLSGSMNAAAAFSAAEKI